MEKQKRMFSYLPDDWVVTMKGTTLSLIAPDPVEAQLLLRGAKCKLRQAAQKLGVLIEIFSPGCCRPVARFGQTYASSSSSSSGQPKQSETKSISSYAPSLLRPDADSEAVEDFIKGKRLENLIVTVTRMKDDKCLKCDDLQALDRGTLWTAGDWIGIDFKTLWRDSFHIGRTNYYGQLIEAVSRDKFIPQFEYQIRRPSGALAEYQSTYHYVESFLGGPVRIAVSRIGAWSLVEDEHLEGEA